MDPLYPAQIRPPAGDPAGLFASDADAVVAVILTIALIVAIAELVRGRLSRNKIKVRRRN